MFYWPKVTSPLKPYSNTKLAKQHNVWIVAGSIPLHSDKAGKIKQALLVFDNRGEQVARYNKIHLFDVLIEESGESYNESSIMDADEQSVVIDSPFGKIGLSICYDLRFPELYRLQTKQGAEL